MVPDLIWAPDFFGPQEIWSPSSLVPKKFGTREMWSQEIWSQYENGSIIFMRGSNFLGPKSQGPK
jgi:hypothetical protein